jgi:hypothetical protein
MYGQWLTGWADLPFFGYVGIERSALADNSWPQSSRRFIEFRKNTVGVSLRQVVMLI